MSSIRLRLFVILALVSSVVWSVAAGWVYVRTQHEVERVLDARLIEASRMVSSLLSSGEVARIPSQGPLTSTTRRASYDRQLSCQIWSLDGALVGRSDGAPGRRLTTEASGFSETTIEGERWRVYAVENSEAGVRVLVGDNLGMRDHLVQSVITGLIAPAGLGLLAMAGLIWMSVGRGLAPIRSVTRVIAAREANDLSPVMTPEAATELKPFTDALNGLIGRLDAARQRESQFISAAAHELRTPLAGLRVQAQIAASATDKTLRDAALAQMTGSVDRTARLVSQLLEMSRSEGLTSTLEERRWISLDDIWPDLIKRAGAHSGIDIRGPGPVSLHAQSHPLSVILGNLLSNAAAYADGRVDVRLETGEPCVRLIVEDDGPGVAVDDLTRLGQRFFRAANARPGGHGLGLSIAEACARAQGWRMDYARSGLGGLRVNLSLPAADVRAEV
ncbi:MAG: sensor histidine kinase N-terminal domain-containing protein [Alphaproteobacteria bacterium]|nr:sensor histidine kinase N-terminal domain-containing protein [Alphaproteobacteria bacterium]MBU2378379.1 sensor histidine kinase N-terminal domain-containing protein [Alphaproteobacteria bacterium]